MTEFIPEELLPLDDRTSSVIPVLSEGDAYLRARIFEQVQEVTKGVPDPEIRASLAARMIKSLTD